MQQTETYKLNLIETSDTFSPAALNENAQKLESGLAAARAEAAAGVAAEAQARVNADAAEAAARSNADAAEAQTRAAGDAALEQRITILEGKHAVGGTYIGTGGTQTIQLGFTPQVIFAYNCSTRYEMVHRGVKNSTFSIVEGGFSVSNSAGTYFNVQGSPDIFIAIG